MRTLGFYGILFVSAVAAPLGCGDPFTSAPPDSSASTSSSSTSTSSTSGTGGAGGGDGSGGGGGAEGGSGGATSSSSSSSGGGGQGGCSACVEGQFCTASDTCVSCSDLRGVVSFGTLTEIPVPGTDPSFPRVRAETGVEGADQRLVYAARFGAGNLGLGTVLGRPWAEGAEITSSAINTEQPESGPFLLPEDASSPIQGFPKGTIFFDRVVDATLDVRRIFAVSALDATESVEVEALKVEQGSYSVTVAHAAPRYRYWFMNKRQENGSTVTQLVTKLATDTEVKPLHIKLPGGCEAKGDDLAPWVMPDGSYLFFQAPYSAVAECGVAKVLRSFYVKLGPDGLPEGDRPAVMLMPNIEPSVAIKTPSLSPDACTIFVASNKDGAQKLYTATRR